MAASSRRQVVVADSSKLGSPGAVRVLATEQMNVLITDRAASPAHLAELRRRGVKVTKV
jgi:DeoR/GlpR family transcriptional regulator of sugar metabolism